MAYRPSVHPPCPLSMLGKTKSNGFLKIPSNIKPFYDFLCNPYPILGDSHILFRAVWAPSKPREATDLSKMVDHFYRVFPCISNFSIYDLVLQHTEPPKKTNSTSMYITIFRLPYYFHLFLPLSSWGLSKRTSLASTPSSSCVFMRTCLKSSREPLNHLGSVKTDSTLAPTWEDADFCGSTCDLIIK